MRLLSISLLLPVVLALTVAGQVPLQPGNPGSIEGVIVNAVTSEPIRRVEVNIFSISGARQMPNGQVVHSENPRYSASTLTDNTGRFQFPALEPGRYQIVYTKVGFFNEPARGGMASRASRIVEVQPGQSMANLVCTLLPQAVVTGRVLDDEGEPMQNVTVMALRREYYRGKVQWNGLGRDNTDDRGVYRISGIPSGKVWVIAEGETLRLSSGAPEGAAPEATRLVPTYHPNATDVNAAVPVDAKAGVETGNLDIALRKVPVFRISGVRVDADGNPLPRSSVRLAPRDRALALSMHVNANFTTADFKISNVRPGKYTLLMQSFPEGSAAGSRYTAAEPIEITSGNVDGVTLRGRPPRAVSGSVVFDRGDAPLQRTGRRQVSAYAMDHLLDLSSLTGDLQDDGSFSIPNIPPGRYALLVHREAIGNAYQWGITHGGVTTQDPIIEVGDTDISGVKIHLRPGAARLSGTVERTGADGNTRVAVAVLHPVASWLVAQQRALGYEPSAIVSSKGTFEITPIVPGEYHVWAFTDYQDGALLVPEIYEKLKNSAITVHVKEGETASLALKVTDFTFE